MKRAFILLFVFVASLALADKPMIIEEIRGRVPGVIDGDTFTLHTNGKAASVRLEGIDAPESAQKFGPQSREALKKLITGKDVIVQKTGIDKYKRILGTVFVDKTDVCAKMVEDGWAWHFTKYSSDAQLAKLENQARTAKRGLWQDEKPVAPWDYREQKQVSETIAVVPVKPAPAKPIPLAEPKATKPTEPAAKYWITSSSGIRHNSRCQHYANSNGRYCGASEGRACKKCGG